ncbi:MAG: lysylphosphatidylglycerol synthase transmembrane domain-containing protein [Patescibacteria group bacterium]
MLRKIFLLIKKIQAWFSSRVFNRIVFVLLAVLGLSLFILLFWYADFNQIIKAISSVFWLNLAAIFGFVFLVLGLAAWRWQLILRGYGYKKSLANLLGLVFRSAAISLIFPSFEVSGETYKAIRLKKTEVSTPAAFASVFFDYFAVLFVNIFFGAGLLAYVALVGFQHHSLLIFGSGMVLFIAFLILLLRKFFQRGWFSEMIVKKICSVNPVVCYTDEKTLEDIKLFDYGISFFLKESKTYLVKSFLVSILGFVWELAQIWLVLLFLGVWSDFLMVAMFYLAINFFNSVPVFGGIGFGEVGAFLAGASLGISDSTALSLVLLLRLRQLVVILIAGWLFVQDNVKSFFGSSPRQINKQKPESFNQDFKVQE